MTSGLEVLVQLVMAAMTTEPWVMVDVLPSPSGQDAAVWVTVAVSVVRAASTPRPLGPTGAVRAFSNAGFMSERSTRSCGRLGPAREGTTVARSSSSTAANSGSGASADHQSLFALA